MTIIIIITTMTILIITIIIIIIITTITIMTITITIGNIFASGNQELASKAAFLQKECEALSGFALQH